MIAAVCGLLTDLNNFRLASARKRYSRKSSRAFKLEGSRGYVDRVCTQYQVKWETNETETKAFTAGGDECSSFLLVRHWRHDNKRLYNDVMLASDLLAACVCILTIVATFELMNFLA